MLVTMGVLTAQFIFANARGFWKFRCGFLIFLFSLMTCDGCTWSVRVISSCDWSEFWCGNLKHVWITMSSNVWDKGREGCWGNERLTCCCISAGAPGICKHTTRAYLLSIFRSEGTLGTGFRKSKNQRIIWYNYRYRRQISQIFENTVKTNYVYTSLSGNQCKI